MTPSNFIADFFKHSSGSIYLCSLPNERNGGRPAEICGRGGGARLDELVLQGWDRKDRGTFFCISTLSPKQSRRSKETVFEITCLHIDIDFRQINVEPDAVLKRLEELEYPPSKVVNSGHGYHAYWLLSEALPITPELIVQTEEALRGLANMLGGDPAVCEISRLMRVPGSFNTKNGERLAVTVLVDSDRRYELDDLREWIAETRPLIPRKGEASTSNPFLAVAIPSSGPTVDVEARLASMRFQGAGDTSIHPTQVSVTAAMLSRGVSVDETVQTVLDATRKAAGATGEKWDWRREEKDIRAMCASWAKKKLNGQQPAAATAPSQFVFDGAEPVAPPDMLVDEMLPKHGLVIVGGQSGAGKTFLVILKAACLASGLPFFGKDVHERAGTLYVAAEGQGMVAARVAAAKGALGLDVERPLPIAWLRAPPPLDTTGEVERFVADLRVLDAQFQEKHGMRLGAVIFDTVAATFSMKDENDNAEAARAVSRMRQVADGFGGLVIAVHHYGKTMEAGLRGASAWRAGADIVIAALAEVDPLTGTVSKRELAVTKSRDGVTGPVAPFSLEFVSLGTTARGEEFGTCRIVPDLVGESTFGKKKRKAARSEIALRDAVDVALSNHGKEVTLRDRPVRAVTIDRVKDEFKKQYVTGDEDNAKATHARLVTFNRALARLPTEFSMGEFEGVQWIWRA